MSLRFALRTRAFANGQSRGGYPPGRGALSWASVVKGDYNRVEPQRSGFGSFGALRNHKGFVVNDEGGVSDRRGLGFSCSRRCSTFVQSKGRGDG
ncbi:hypothetical protein SUGI_0880490 [Cryptomeria japonica]|nr:hypothetical protein SUGI_0880490 [Cryptomeria japonica]